VKKQMLMLAAGAILVLALLAAGCGGNDDEAAGDGGSTTMTHDGMDTGAAAAGDGTAIESAAVDTRVALDRLLGEHALLAMFATQKGLKGEEDFEAIAGTLDANSQDLAEVIGSVYGDEAAQTFLDGDLLWRFHINQFVAYTQGLAADDQAAQKAAVDKLMGYVEAQAAFFAEATGAPKADVKAALTEHIGDLKGQIDQYASGDYGQSYATLRTAYAHMFMTGDALSGAIAEQQSLEAGDVAQASSDLRVTLGRLLGEHAYLAMVATQKGYSGSEDFEQIAGALDANSKDIAAAIGSIYGDEAAKTFLDGDLLWRFHINQFVAYTQALAAEDEAAQKDAVDKLMGYVEAQAAFFADATGADKGAVRDALEMHVMELKGQIDAYAAGDYEEAYRLAREAYAHMWTTSDALTAAIVAQGTTR
jgi:hypothetical protein